MINSYVNKKLLVSKIILLFKKLFFLQDGISAVNQLKGIITLLSCD